MNPDDKIEIISCHAEGEVGDVIVSGVAPPPGDTIWQQSRWIAKDDRLPRSSRALKVARGLPEGKNSGVTPETHGRKVTGSRTPGQTINSHRLKGCLNLFDGQILRVPPSLKAQ